MQHILGWDLSFYMYVTQGNEEKWFSVAFCILLAMDKARRMFLPKQTVLDKGV